MKGGLLMPSIATEKSEDSSFSSRTLSNVQLELIKLYSTNLEYDELMELRKVLANHFAQKAMNGADTLWNQKEMSMDTMETWLNEQ